VAETSQYAAQLAFQAGIFEKNGLSVEITVFEGDGKVMQALQAGQIDVGWGGTSAAIASQVTDAPVVQVATNAIILSDLLIGGKDIKTADDLRGKCVAVSTFGGTSHGAVILALEALGLTDQDVVITEVGGQAARISAVEGGSCGAAPVDIARQAEMAELGLNELANLAEAGLPWGRSGMNITKEFMAANPNTVIVVAASALEGQNLMWTDPDLAAEKYAEFIQEPDIAVAKALILEFQNIGNRDLMWPDEAFSNPQRVLATTNPPILEIDAATAFDRSVLNGLVASGFYEANEIPIDNPGWE
jgi:ABC-type nitrate/sulfonate/bicarbonate transport system substrate-binding protein